MEKGRAVCPGEELTYNCTMFDDLRTYQTVWLLYLSPSSQDLCSHGLVSVVHDESQASSAPSKCGPFTAQDTGTSGYCHNSTLTVTASPGLNGTVVSCSENLKNGVIAGSATILLLMNPGIVNTAINDTFHDFSL